MGKPLDYFVKLLKIEILSIFYQLGAFSVNIYSYAKKKKKVKPKIERKQNKKTK